MVRIVTVRNGKTKEFFFAKEHSSYGLGDEWVPVTSCLPMKVTPRPGLPDGIINTTYKYVFVFLDDYKEILAPIETGILEPYLLKKV